MPFHRKIAKRVLEAADEIIPAVSRVLVHAVPGSTEETLSGEVAKSLGTTVRGAHAAMIMPFWLTAPPGGQQVLEQALIFDVGRGPGTTADEIEVLRWIPKIGVTAGFRKRVERAFRHRQREVARELTKRRR